MDDAGNEQLLRLLLLHRLQKQCRERSQRCCWICWVRPILLRRDQVGEYHTLAQEMRNVDPVAHQRYFRMTAADFDDLLSLVSLTIQKHTTNMRNPISPGERLAVTLGFLSAGGSMNPVAESYRIGYATIRKIIPEVCSAIWYELGPRILAFPGPYDWRQIAKDFQHIWQFPNCVGSLDGKHVLIEKKTTAAAFISTTRASAA